MLMKPNGCLVALKAHTLPFSLSIATEGSKSSLENQKVLKTARGAGSYCPHNFRHSQRSASILRYPLPILCGLGKVLREPSLGVSFLQCVGWRLWTVLTQSLGCN